MRPFLNLYTHDGLFHADDVFAAAMLSLMAEEIHVTRGSDLDLPADDGSWIIFDIGGGELDHHTPENKEHNGTHPNTNIPYAACGLVWRKYYREILAEMEEREAWFTARGNYSWYACEALNAERSILSQSGGGVCWDWQHDPKNNMTDTYESTVGVLHGPEAEARGCTKPWDFASHPADIVCIRLLTNDIAGIGGKRFCRAV